MAWTPPTDAVEVSKPTTAWKPPADAVETPTKPKIGKLSSAGSGLLQGATLGLGDELSGLARAIFEGVSPSDPTQGRWEAMKQGYTDTRDSERASNEAARAANPMTYGATEIAGSLPAFAATGAASLPLAAAKTAAVAGTSSFGNAEGSAMDQTKATALGATVGGAIPVVGKVVGGTVRGAAKGLEDLYSSGAIPGSRTLNRVIDKVTGSSGKVGDAFMEAARSGSPAAKETYSSVLKNAASKKVPEVLTGAAANAATGAVTAGLVGQDPLTGAAVGAFVPRRFVDSGKAVQAGAKVVGNQGAKLATKLVDNATTKATTTALLNMTGDDAKRVKAKYEPRIQEAVNRGQPIYAATFQAVSSSPELKRAMEVDEDDDVEEE